MDDQLLEVTDEDFPELKSAKLVVTETLSGALGVGEHSIPTFSLALAMVRWLRGHRQPVIWILSCDTEGPKEEHHPVIRSVLGLGPLSERPYWEYLLKHGRDLVPKGLTDEEFWQWHDAQYERERELKKRILGKD